MSTSTSNTIPTEREVSKRLLPLIICAVALLPVSLSLQAVGGGGVQVDRPVLTTQKIQPGDGSERDPAFARVRQVLLSATRRNDLDAVVRHFAPQTRCYTAVGLIKEEGMMMAEQCAEKLRANPEVARDFLSDLQNALQIGTAFDEGMIIAPYVAVAGNIVMSLPEITGHYYVVVADRVRARSAPSSRAAVVELLSYDIVTKVSANADAVAGTEVDACAAWEQIVTPSKREAWICAKYLAAPLDGSRFVFQRQPDGQWRLTGVYASD